MTLADIATAIAEQIKTATFANVVVDFVADELSIFAETEADYNAAKEFMVTRYELVDEDIDGTYYTAFFAI
jgi:hypothetical protein